MYIKYRRIEMKNSTRLICALLLISLVACWLCSCELIASQNHAALYADAELALTPLI